MKYSRSNLICPKRVRLSPEFFLASQLSSSSQRFLHKKLRISNTLQVSLRISAIFVISYSKSLSEFMLAFLI